MQAGIDANADGNIDQGETVYWCWNSGSHTNSLIPFYSRGAGSQYFEGYAVGTDNVRGSYLDNTDIFTVMDTVIGELDAEQTAVVDFQADAGVWSVLLSWALAEHYADSELYVLRSESENGPYARITANILASDMCIAPNSACLYRDNCLSNIKRYFFKLESVNPDGMSAFWGPVSATPRCAEILLR